MKCRSCSAEIADKAIVCYRCGTPTDAPAPSRNRAKPARASRTRLIVLLVVLVAALALLAFTYLRRLP